MPRQETGDATWGFLWAVIFPVSLFTLYLTSHLVLWLVRLGFLPLTALTAIGLALYIADNQ